MNDIDTAGKARADHRIQRLGPRDVPLMRAVLDCFGEVFDEVDTYCSAQPDDAYLEELLSGGGFVAIAAVREGGEVIGGLAGYELRKFERRRSELYIYDLGVREPWRRKGVATALLEESKRVARERGAWVVYVQADPEDAPAVALYTKLGRREDVFHFDLDLDPRGRA